MKPSFSDFLRSKGACSEAVAFVGDKKLKQAWESATRPDWMLWLMENASYKDDQLYRLYACWCAANTPLGDGRVTWDLLTDKRSRKAILVAIDFANGEATQEELAAARAAAWAAAWDAAGDAAGAAGDAAGAAWDAARAAWAAARAAAWDAAGDAAGAARDAAGAAQAQELRRRVDFKKLERLVRNA